MASHPPPSELVLHIRLPGSIAEYRPEREKRPACPVPAILPVFPYPGDIVRSSPVYFECWKLEVGTMFAYPMRGCVDIDVSMCGY